MQDDNTVFPVEDFFVCLKINDISPEPQIRYIRFIVDLPIVMHFFFLCI